MISALLLSIIGVPEEVIARDYARSERGLESIHRETVEFMARSGLGPEFANAPEEVSLREKRRGWAEERIFVPCSLFK